MHKNFNIRCLNVCKIILKYIVKLKKLYSETEWDKQRERFLQGKTSSRIRYEFLVEEQLFERLLQEIRKNQSVMHWINMKKY